MCGVRVYVCACVCVYVCGVVWCGVCVSVVWCGVCVSVCVLEVMGKTLFEVKCFSVFVYIIRWGSLLS